MAMVDYRRVSLHQLAILVAVAREGSLSGAARHLQLSQPTVSENIARLEQSLGLRLVSRRARGSVLTAVGEQVVEQAGDVLRAADAFDHAVTQLRTHTRPVLRVAASLTVAEHLVPGWIVDDSLGADVDLAVRNSTRVAQLVGAGEVEIGFVEGPTLGRGLESRVIGTDRLVVVVSPRHPWAGRTAPLSPAELVAAPVVVRERGSGTRATLDLALAEVGLALPVSSTTMGSTAAVVHTVESSAEYVAVLSHLVARPLVRYGELREVPLAGLDLTRELRAVWAREHYLSPSARRLVSVAASSGS